MANDFSSNLAGSSRPLSAPNVVASRDASSPLRARISTSRPSAPGPTVVFEAGLGNDSTTWKFVAGPIAAFARVVLYDHAGLGRSLPMTKKDSAVTSDKVATNLHALLAAADIRPPYIWSGIHSAACTCKCLRGGIPRKCLALSCST
jgi:pimeloyl-ACP methyl ester carboxylesterase